MIDWKPNVRSTLAVSSGSNEDPERASSCATQHKVLLRRGEEDIYAATDPEYERVRRPTNQMRSLRIAQEEEQSICRAVRPR